MEYIIKTNLDYGTKVSLTTNEEAVGIITGFFFRGIANVINPENLFYEVMWQTGEKGTYTSIEIVEKDSNKKKKFGFI